jgi:hypothetical protein
MNFPSVKFTVIAEPAREMTERYVLHRALVEYPSAVLDVESERVREAGKDGEVDGALLRCGGKNEERENSNEEEGRMHDC